MKKTIRVNISGFVFNLDDDAFQKLNTYLRDIESRFTNAEEGKEIISDVESRISEIFQEKIKLDKEVINLEDVDAMIEIMGTPADFQDEDEIESDESDDKAEKQSVRSEKSKTKRMYRDIDNRILGGVCGGLASYFNMDPVIMRVIFAILFFVGFGSIAIIYILLWIIVPPAISTSQKLEMKGEKVNLSNIQKSIRDEFDDVKNNLQDIRHSKRYESTRTTFEKILRACVEIVVVLLRVAVKFLAVLFILIGFACVAGLIISFFVSKGVPFQWHGFHNDFPFWPFVSEIIGFQGSLFWGILGLALVVLIPFIMLTYIGIKMLFTFKSNNAFIGLLALGLWIIGIMLLSVFAIGKVTEFKEPAADEIRAEINTNNDTLYLALNKDYTASDDEYQDEKSFHLDNMKFLKINDKYKVFSPVKLDIRKSENQKIELVMKRKARGGNHEDAKANIQNIIYQWNLKDSLLTFDQYFNIREGGKWRKQELNLILRVPINKVVILKDGMEEIIYDIQNTSNMWDFEMIGKKWKMTEDGLTLFGISTEEVRKQNNKKEEISKDDIDDMKEELDK